MASCRPTVSANYNSLADARAQQNATQVVKYTYDYSNRRIRETVTVGGTTTYDYLVYDGGGMPYLEFSTPSGLATSSPVLTDRYLNAAAVDLVSASGTGPQAKSSTSLDFPFFNSGTAKQAATDLCLPHLSEIAHPIAI
jgi:YD repeat-containing protein